MEIRKTVPDSKNKYYLKQPAGWNKCILGNPDNRLYPNSVLSNCTGYSVGRLNETCRANNCRWLGSAYPGGFLRLAKAQGLETGEAIRPGCIVVLVKDDGVHGHTLNVEKVSGGQFLISESGWHFKKGHFVNTRWTTKAKNFGMSPEYHFKVCIYSPGVDPYEIPPEHFSSKKYPKSKYNKFIQWALVKEKCYADKNDDSCIDGSAGAKTQAAIKVYQAKHGLTVDGSAGAKTIALMIKDYALV